MRISPCCEIIAAQQIIKHRIPISQQLTFSECEFSSKRCQTRKEIFLSRMDNLLPWSQLLERDRNGSFEPKLIKKGEKQLGGFAEHIVSRYARGMSTRDI